MRTRVCRTSRVVSFAPWLHNTGGAATGGRDPLPAAFFHRLPGRTATRLVVPRLPFAAPVTAVGMRPDPHQGQFVVPDRGQRRGHSPALPPAVAVAHGLLRPPEAARQAGFVTRRFKVGCHGSTASIAMAPEVRGFETSSLLPGRHGIMRRGPTGQTRCGMGPSESRRCCVDRASPGRPPAGWRRASRNYSGW